MAEFRVRFLEHVERTQSVASFRFKLDLAMDFIPGQFAQIIFDEENRANKQLNKYLSFSSSPDKPYLELTKRLSSSDFCKKLLALKEGDELLFKGPMGHCVFDPSCERIGFLIGGIGITPVISILEHIVAHDLKVDAHLLYSNLSDEDIAFKPELDDWSKLATNIRIEHTVVNRTKQGSPCFVGMITKEFVLQQMADYKDRVFYLFGPPAMVEAMKAICAQINCDPAKVKTENFVGY
jgi:ferredoxin-NADP reductase